MPRLESLNQCPTCTGLKPTTKRLCDKCAAIHPVGWAKHKAELLAKNGGKDPYDSQRWQLLRKQAIREGKGLCRQCLAKRRYTPFHSVDHIKPISQGGEFYDPNNLQLLCDECHKAKTAKESHRL
ncbi:HNH endonuclease [Vibrio mytili]|uniref:HNH endonuclease n=1 Tax=Vibrio mytili TaxID=50718 RepID=UPI002F40C7DD